MGMSKSSLVNRTDWVGRLIALGAFQHMIIRAPMHYTGNV